MTIGLRSMTGYGSASKTVERWTITVACKSVNHRRLDIRVHVPNALWWVEPRVKKRVKGLVHRGRIEVRIDAELQRQSSTRVDFDLIDEDRFAAVAEELKRLAVDYRLVAPVSLEAIWEYREFFERGTERIFSEDNASTVLSVVDEALNALVDSRRGEGRGIGEDLRHYCQTLLANIDDVEAIRKQNRQEHENRARKRLGEALEAFDVQDGDQNRLRQELAYYVERGNIAEEIQRARSHLERLLDVMANDDQAVGKKIDFYLQELIRETNTMGSKSQSPAMTDLVIEMKSGIEKMREQAANIE